jgi:hypothetical protein
MIFKIRIASRLGCGYNYRDLGYVESNDKSKVEKAFQRNSEHHFSVTEIKVSNMFDLKKQVKTKIKNGIFQDQKT